MSHRRVIPRMVRSVRDPRGFASRPTITLFPRSGAGFQSVRVRLIKLVGEHRIALGSDYPLPLGERAPGSLIEQMSDLSDATTQRLLASTARKILGIDESRFSAAATGGVNRDVRTS